MTAPNLNASQAIVLLKELASVAEDATLTGAFADGLSSARDKINWLMAWAEAQEIAPAGFFRPLSEKAGWGEVGVEARMMMASLKDSQERFEADFEPEPEEEDDDIFGGTFGPRGPFGPKGPFGPQGPFGVKGPFGPNGPFAGGRGRRERRAAEPEAGIGGRLQDPGVLVAMAPFLDSEDLAAMVTAHMEAGGEFDEGLLVALAPFLGSQTLGRLVKARMMRGRAPAAPQAPQAPPAPEAPVAPPAPSGPVAPHAPAAPVYEEPVGAEPGLTPFNQHQAYHQHQGGPQSQPLPASSHDPSGTVTDHPAIEGAVNPPSLPENRQGW
jgi:hypothetical protein